MTTAKRKRKELHSVDFEKSSAFRFASDVWKAASLGVSVPSHDRAQSLTFHGIEPEWLKISCKQFIRYSAATKGYSSLKAYIVSIRMFARFLSERGINATPETISRELILEYIHYLNVAQSSWVTRHQRLVLLRVFFEICSINDWLNVPPFVIRPEDLPKPQKALPRYIPEEVMRQLNLHLDQLPAPIMRMVLVLQETGLRIGELCSLRLNCIEQDSTGDWILFYTDWKMRRRDQLKPISRELAGVVQEQQQYIRRHFGERFSYLFCANEIGHGGAADQEMPTYRPVPKTMPRQRFAPYLQRLAWKCGIKDAAGRIWHFQSHQFRHTVGTRMINSGVPPHIIQRYLGHVSPEMTMRYAHIHDETLKRELANYLDTKVVNVAGDVVRSANPRLDDDRELQWMKRNVLAQALPNGSCARPVAQGPCPHANACLTCGDFRTTAEFLPQHKAQLMATDAIISNAEMNGWERQAEMNRRVRSNLLKILSSLEGDSV